MGRHQALSSGVDRRWSTIWPAVACSSAIPPVGGAEEAPGAYKDVSAVVEAAEAAHLARKVARLEPRIGING